MDNSFTGRKRVRKYYGRIAAAVPLPNLIEVQRTSYVQFLQRYVPAEKRTSTGLQEVFRSVFPIKDFSERGTLEKSLQSLVLGSGCRRAGPITKSRIVGTFNG